MDKKELYLEAYQNFNNLFPLEFDCGTLCDHSCCKESDEGCGMYLFPGEEQILPRDAAWLEISSANFEINHQPVLIAICDETCERAFRPLACRIFPYTPIIDKNDVLTVREDLRGKGLCPLLQHNCPHKLREDFKEAVFKTFEKLCQDPDIRAFVKEMSEEITALDFLFS